jgi:hypothetical protein
MPSFNDRYPNTGLFKADDLKGQPDLILQISHVDLDVQIASSSKDVVRFLNDGRGLVLNAAIGRTIARLYGDEINDWAEKWIALFCDETVMFNNEPRPGIRVRNLKPNPDAPGMGGAARPAPQRPAARAARPDLDDDIPF